jgi:GTP-binding protein
MDLRNIAIIAHVDHGKTTLVDELLRSPAPSARTRPWPSARWTATIWSASAASPSSPNAPRSNGTGTRINIVDTPGHADFGGEVERILSMVDGVVLLVDAAEGPMPQTKFVTSKALALGLRPIVVLNKVDKPDAEPDRALDEVFDLFAALDATTNSSTSRRSTPRAAPAGPTETRTAPRETSPAVRPDPRHVPAPKVDRRRALHHAGHHAGGRPLPRPHPDRPGRERRIAAGA